MEITKVIQLICFFVGAVFLSDLVNILLLRFSKSLGIRNNNDVVIRWSNQSKPSLGGISFFIVFIFVSIAYTAVYYDEYIFHNKQYIGLLLAGTMAFIMGLADDAYNTKPFAKLSVQILCGLSFVFTDTMIEISGNVYVDATLTVLWVITLMNSLNMLDNMDGITGVTVLFILLACYISSYLIFDFNRNIWTILLVGQIGAVIGFLKHNIHPSKLFMGDAGSQFIALFVAFYSIKNLLNVGTSTNQPGWIGILICLVAFTPAFSDTLTVVINRIKKGQSPMVGGKDHTTHHLVYAGNSEIGVWYKFLFFGMAACVISLVMIIFVQMNILWPLIILSLYFVGVFIYLYRFTLPNRKNKDKIES